MLRFLLWRLLGLIAAVVAVAITGWLLSGGPGKVLRGGPGGHFDPSLPGLAHRAAALAVRVHGRIPLLGVDWKLVAALLAALGAALAVARVHVRARRSYVRLWVQPYRTDRASAESVVRMFEAFHKRVLRRWWRRVLLGQPSVALELHHTGESGAGWVAVACPEGLAPMAESALRVAYANCRVRRTGQRLGSPPAVLRLKKSSGFIKRAALLEHFDHEREPPVNRLLTVMAACGEPAYVQIAMTPAPILFERLAKSMYKRNEARISRERREHVVVRDRSLVEEAELRGGLDVQHRPLFFVDIRVVGSSRGVCEAIASQLRAEGAENHLIERGTAIRQGLLGIYRRRVQRGEGNPLPAWHKGVFASTELAALWQLPSIDYATVPVTRTSLPVAPAPPAIMRPPAGQGTLRDSRGPVSIHVDLRKQNTAVPGTVETGKTSYLVATVAEDLRRPRCAVIVLDPKGDAAEAALSLVRADRTCTLLDFAHPTCGFNPLAVEAPADVIADYVVAALKNLFTDADIRASSDRYLRNAIIAVLAYDRSSTLWDAVRLLSVGEDGYAYRSSVGARVRTLPEFKEISEFFTAELSAQLADARSSTTAKLDAPVNKLARLLNSPSIKRVLLNDSLRLDFDRLIGGEEVLVVKGALGSMGAGNTSVLMQLLVGMLDASLARQQDLVPQQRRVAVALKIDEAPLVLNRGFAETMALKRSAGLETVACWQTDAQWVDRQVREQLDALFAHRVYFATASASDARAAVALTMAEFSDTVRPGIRQLSALGHPDVRLHLPKHHAIASWVTEDGRQAPFVGQTIPLRIDRERLALHAARQFERGGRHRADLRQPHWDRARGGTSPPERGVQATAGAAPGAEAPTARSATAAGAREPRASGTSGTPAESYGELAAIDRAASVRWAKPVSSPRALEMEPLDLEILALVAELRHVLTSQIHRRFNAGRAPTTTQRRLKRLADADLLQRFQFHRRDGGGMPMCCAITSRGLAVLEAERLAPDATGGQPSTAVVPTARRDRRLGEARHDVHVAGWVLAFERALGRRCSLRGADRSVISPPLRSGPEGRPVLGPGDLRLPGGRAPHDFLRTDASGGRSEVEHFDTLRPDAIIEVRANRAVDLIVELDDRLPAGRAAAKLERYDHFLAGWSAHIRRYAGSSAVALAVLFVCRSRARARECARAADSVLCACRAYAGEYPFDWDYPGRASILLAAERDIHEGSLNAYGVAPLPPEVRVAAAHGDPRAAEALTQQRVILDQEDAGSETALPPFGAPTIVTDAP